MRTLKPLLSVVCLVAPVCGIAAEPSAATTAPTSAAEFVHVDLQPQGNQ